MSGIKSNLSLLHIYCRDHQGLSYGRNRNRRGKRYAARLGERWSPPPGEEGGAQSASRQTARSRAAQPDFMSE